MAVLNNTIHELEEPASYSLILTIVWLIDQNYATATRSPVLIGQYAQTREAELEHADLMVEVLKRASETADIKYLVESDSYDDTYEYYDFGDSLSDEEHFYRLYGKKDKAIWFIDGLESFKILEIDLLTEREHYNRNGFFCIVYTGQESNRLQIIKRIFHKLFEIYVININLLLIDGETTHAYTYFPFMPEQCHHSSPELIGSLGPSTFFKFNGKSFFTKKLSNMWGCNMTVTTWQEPPFIIFKNTEIKGIEGLLLTELSKRMNFSIVIKAPPSNDRGFFYPNKTATGATKMLIDRETNITIICLMYDNSRLEIAEAAYPYLSAPLVVGISKGRRMSPFQRLFRPFKYLIWSCLSTSVLSGVLLIFTLKFYFKPFVQFFIFGTQNRKPFTNLWSALYGVPIHGAMPRRNFARYLLAVWIVYTWILRTAYIGQLFLILQDSRSRSNLKTLEEVIQNNYTFFTFPILMSVLFDNLKRPGKISFINSGEYSIARILYRLGHEESKSVITVLGHLIRNYNQQFENREFQVRILPEPILMAPLTFYMTKHSYLSFEINGMLIKIMSAGLIDHFEKLSLSDSALGHKTTQEPAMLSLWLLLGLFTIYLILLLLCFFVFLLELRSARSKILRNIIDFLNC